jgi:hypothetical protein
LDDVVDPMIPSSLAGAFVSIFLVLCGDCFAALGSADGIAQERAADGPPEMSGEA